jgi:hypothetical protein
MQQEWGINASFLLSPILQQKHAIALGCERWILADSLIIYQGLALYYPTPLSIAVLPVFLYEARHGKCSMAISFAHHRNHTYQNKYSESMYPDFSLI